jgi:hypothetical protein
MHNQMSDILFFQHITLPFVVSAAVLNQPLFLSPANHAIVTAPQPAAIMA